MKVSTDGNPMKDWLDEGKAFFRQKASRYVGQRAATIARNVIEAPANIAMHIVVDGCSAADTYTGTRKF